MKPATFNYRHLFAYAAHPDGPKGKAKTLLGSGRHPAACGGENRQPGQNVHEQPCSGAETLSVRRRVKKDPLRPGCKQIDLERLVAGLPGDRVL